MNKEKCISYTPISMCKVYGMNAEKILKAVDDCIIAMGELTIKESKLARSHLDRVMEEMYKRNPETQIKTIQPHQ